MMAQPARIYVVGSRQVGGESVNESARSWSLGRVVLLE